MTKSTSGRASLFVSLGILLSRILGLVRDQVFAHYLGNSPAAGAFRAALRIPNFLQNLFGEGVLSASFIPVYARLRASGDETAARTLAGTVASLLALIVSVLVLIGVSATPWIIDLVAPGFTGDLRALTITLVRVLFPGVGLLVLSAWCLGVLNTHRRFFISYAAPVFWNLALIATLAFFGRRMGGRISESDLVIKLAWGSVVGSFLQLAVQVPFVFQAAGRIPFRLALRATGEVPDGKPAPAWPAGEVFKNLGPVMISRGVVQLSAYIDGMIASYLGAAAVASLAYAQTIYLLPVSLFGMAVAAAELPELSVQAGETAAARAQIARRIVSGRRRIAFFVVPSAVAFLLLGRPVVEVLYQTGRFGSEDTLFVWYILVGSVIGLLAATWGRLYASAFYAMKDTRTPLKFAVVRVALTIVLGLIFAFPLRPFIALAINTVPGLHVPLVDEIAAGLGAVGLTASAGLAGWIEFLLLRNALETRIGDTSLGSGFMLKVWGAALIAGGLTVTGDLVVRTGVELSPVARRTGSLAELGVYGLIYLMLAGLFGIGEVRSLIGKLKRTSP